MICKKNIVLIYKMSNLCNINRRRGRPIYNNDTNCRRICRNNVDCKGVRDTVYNNYRTSGILVRGNDGQQTYTIKQIGDAISSNDIAFDFKQFNDSCGNANLFSGLLANLSPPYSASLISGVYNNFPIAWYNKDYSEAFQDPPRKHFGSQGHRSLFAIILKNGKINIKGGFLFDADSNLRNMGNFPAINNQDKTTPSSLWSNTLPFKDVSGNSELYSAPTTNNNNPVVNPLFRPRTTSGVAENKNEVNKFLFEIAYLKQIFVNKLYTTDTSGAVFKEFINTQLGTGVEPEILVKPRGEENYYSQKFNPTDISAFALISDSTPEVLRDDVSDLNNQITISINNFISTATGDNGWINNTNKSYLRNLPVIGIFNVALPDLPLDNTSSQGGDPVGTAWLNYLNSSTKFKNKLSSSDFICRKDFV